jgi:hypothetical protein
MTSNYSVASVSIVNFPVKVVSYTVMLTNTTTAAAANGPVLAKSGVVHADAEGVILLEFGVPPPAVAYVTVEESSSNVALPSAL